MNLSRAPEPTPHGPRGRRAVRGLVGWFLALATAACGSSGDLVITYIESGSPKAAVDVTIVLGQENFDRYIFDYEGRTNAAGEAEFRDLAVGTYWYEVSGKGPTDLFDLIDGSADVRDGEETRVTVTGGRQ